MSRLRQVAVYFGLADEDPAAERDLLAGPSSWKERVLRTAILATVIGLIVALRRTPELGAAWGLGTLLGATSSDLVDNLGHARGLLPTTFAAAFLLQVPIFSGVHAAIQADVDSAQSLAWGLLMATVLSAVATYDARKRRSADRRTAAR